MKVLFINIARFGNGRTYMEYPYGIGILATLSDRAGYSVHILDMAVDSREYRKVIEEYEPDIIAVSFLSPSVQIAIETIKQIDSFFEGPILAGGIHSTLYPNSVLAYGADIVMLGEGELIFVPILKCITEVPMEKRDERLKNIPNIVYRDFQGKIQNTKSNEISVNLDMLPIMNRNLFDLKLYAHHTILTSRCCPYNCHFCCSWAPGGKPGRIMSSQRILQELEWLVEQYGSLTLYWGDEIFFWNQDERIAFCKLLKERKFPIKFIMQLRADLVEPKLINELIDIGCIKLCIGAESGSDYLLQMANKNIKAFQIEQAIDTCVKAGLICKTWWMVGLPNAGKEEQLKALDLIERTKPNEVAVHQFVPLPGSHFWNYAEKYGIHLPEEGSFENLNYYSAPENMHYDYISGLELYDVLKTYEEKLIQLGYVSTDKADETSKYVFTTPFQNTTFDI